jgi:UDP:flavonoid glycosyltransferase YjiC (YdhE family)
MPRIATLALGTRGDVELILLLARELRRRDHDVVVATSACFADRVAAAGAECMPIGSGDRERMLTILTSSMGEARLQARGERFIHEWIGATMESALAGGDLRTLVSGADGFISNLKIVLDREGRLAEPGSEIVPGAVVTYDPPWSLEGLARLAPVSWQQRDILDLVALPQALFDPEGAWGTWGKDYRFTGFWSAPRDESESWRPPRALADFLVGKPPPVVVTPGSMAGFDTAGFIARIVETLGRCGLRGVLLPGWSGIVASPAPDILHVAGEVPYGWLFPRACCIVHHGSHGATAAALMAGRPSIVMPYIGCQETMGKPLLWAGVATGMLDPMSFDPSRLAGAIREALGEVRVHAAVAYWHAMIVADGGVSRAADLVEGHLLRRRTDSTPS